MEIGGHIKSQREKRKWSQQELANKLNISHQSISKWEKGTALPSFANVVALSDLFQISIDALVREDTALMKKLAHPTERPLSLVLIISYGLGILGALISLRIGIQESTFISYTQPIILIGIIFLLSLMYRSQRQQSSHLNRLTLIVAILILSLLLVPQIDDILLGFLSGLQQES